MSSSPAAEVGRRNQVVMAATVFVVFTGFAFVIPFLPLYVRQLGVESEGHVAAWAGVLIGVSPLVAGILAPFWGRLGDRHGQKRIALLALGTYVVVLVLTALVRDVWQLLAARVAIGLFGGIGPLSLAMATAQAPREQTGKAVGRIQAAQILAAALGPLTGGLLADSIGIRATFVVTAAVCAVGVFLVAHYYEEGPTAAPARPAAPGGSFAEILRLPGVLPLLVMLFLVNFIGRSFTPILPLYLQTLGVSADRLALSTGLLISVYSMAAAISAAGLGRASRHLSPRLLLFGSLLGGALTVLPMALVPSFGPLLLLGMALGLVSGGALTLCYTMGGLLISSDRRATAFGFLSAAALFGGSVSPSVAGLLARWDLRGIFFLDGALYVALALALLIGLRRHDGSDPAAAR
jgi:DHA1 family multidrug resistance protein-like MFS transporter